MRSGRVAVAVLATISAAAGCAGPDVASVGPNVPRAAPIGSLGAPFVPAGTVFSVRMDRSIDTWSTPPGTPFTADVVDPLRAASGEVLVPYGAKLRGAIVSVGSPDRPRLRLRIETVDTIGGTLPVQAAVRVAQHLARAGPPRLEPEITAGSAYPDESDFYDPDWNRPYWAGPSAAPFYGEALVRPREILVPSGALVELELVRPLAVPPVRR